MDSSCYRESILRRVTTFLCLLAKIETYERKLVSADVAQKLKMKIKGKKKKKEKVNLPALPPSWFYFKLIGTTRWNSLLNA